MNPSYKKILGTTVLSTGFLCIFASACLQTPSVSPPLQTSKSAIVGGISLGEGYNAVSDEATNEICLAKSGFVSETHPTSQPFTAFMIEESIDLPFEVDRYMRDDVDVADYSTKVGDFYDEFLEARQGQGKFLSMLVALPTVKRELTAQVVDDPDSTCDTNPPSDFYEFVSRCGTEFLAGENYGVMILLVADVTDDSLSDRLEYSELLNLNVVSNSIDADNALSDLISAGHDIEWNVRVLTPSIPSPASNLLNNGRLPSSNWDTYVQQLEDEYITQGQITDPTYGEVLTQDFEQYKTTTIEDCGGLQPGAELACYYEVANANAILLHDEMLHRQYQRAQWVIDNQSRVRFAALDNDDGATLYEAWINDYETCRDSTIDDVLAECHDAILNEENDLCTPCDIPTTCDPRELTARGLSLPEATIVAKLDEAVHGNEYAATPSNSSTTSSADETCVLTSFMGKFSTINDKAIVGWDGNEWSIEQGGNGHGSMYCVDLARFVDGKTIRGGSLDWNISTYSETVNTDTDSDPIGSTSYAPSVAGAQGAFDGGGEYIQTQLASPSNPTPTMDISSFTGSDFTGHVITFGTPHVTTPTWTSPPLTNQTSWALDENDADLFTHNISAVETKLAPVDEGLCFLTKLNGQFDGLGETVQLKKRDNFWHLSISSGCAKVEKGVLAGRACAERKDVRAIVRCYNYEQL